MAKRMIDSDIWDSLLDISCEARFLYLYLTTNCSNSGLITPHAAKVKLYCGNIDVESCLNELIKIGFVQKLATGKIVLPEFLAGNFSNLKTSTSKPVVSAREELIKNGFNLDTLYKGFPKGLETLKEKEKEKEKDKEKDKGGLGENETSGIWAGIQLPESLNGKTEQFKQAWQDWEDNLYTNHKFQYANYRVRQKAIDDVFISNGYNIPKVLESVLQATKMPYKRIYPADSKQATGKKTLQDRINELK